MLGEMGSAGAEMGIEEEEMSVDRNIALHSFGTEELKEMVLRVCEVADGKKGVVKAHRRATEAFRYRLHKKFHQEVPESHLKLFEEQLSYSLPQTETEAISKRLW